VQPIVVYWDKNTSTTGVKYGDVGWEEVKKMTYLEYLMIVL